MCTRQRGDLLNTLISDDLKLGPRSTVDTFRALSDDKSLALFNMVAFTLPRDTGVLMARLGLTRKQYYSKIGAGLVMRKNGKHLLTSLCKVAYESNLLIGQAIENYWKLKAIDSIEMSVTDYDLSAGERKKIVETLIKKKDIKNILLG